MSQSRRAPWVLPVDPPARNITTNSSSHHTTRASSLLEPCTTRPLHISHHTLYYSVFSASFMLCLAGPAKTSEMVWSREKMRACPRHTTHHRHHTTPRTHHTPHHTSTPTRHGATGPSEASLCPSRLSPRPHGSIHAPIIARPRDYHPCLPLVHHRPPHPRRAGVFDSQPANQTAGSPERRHRAVVVFPSTERPPETKPVLGAACGLPATTSPCGEK